MIAGEWGHEERHHNHVHDGEFFEMKITAHHHHFDVIFEPTFQPEFGLVTSAVIFFRFTSTTIMYASLSIVFQALW